MNFATLPCTVSDPSFCTPVSPRARTTSDGYRVVTPGSPNNSSPPRPREDSQSLGAASKRPTLLIVDDDVTTTRGFAKVLEFEGYCVFTAFDAETGLAMIERYAPDAILLDLRIPQADDGLSFLQRMRAHGCGTPVAIVTGDCCMDDHLLRQLGDLGAEVRFKPLWLEDLLVLVRSLISVNREPPPQSS
jgi:DNA-binding NtrC family response regulator